MGSGAGFDVPSHSIMKARFPSKWPSPQLSGPPLRAVSLSTNFFPGSESGALASSQRV